MTQRSGLITLFAAILAVLVFVTPLGPLPGFFIGGQPTSVPRTWPNTAKVDEILLKVPGILPRVVVIWVVQVDGAFYVVGNSASGWVERLGDGAAVEMRLSGNTYALMPGRSLKTSSGCLTPIRINIDRTTQTLWLGSQRSLKPAISLACFAWSLARPVRCQPRCPCAAVQTAGSYAVR